MPHLTVIYVLLVHHLSEKERHLASSWRVRIVHPVMDAGIQHAVSFAERRTAAGLSADKAAREFGVPLATVADWDHGAQTPPGHVLRSLELIGRFGTDAGGAAAHLSDSQPETQVRQQRLHQI
jgi:hypothetical protein